MKTLIIYKSYHHYNTQKIARVMAKILKAKLTKPEAVKPAEIKNYDLIGFGSGIYFGKHHQSLFKLVDKVPWQKDKKAFIFSTKGAFTFYKVYHLALKNKLKEKGWQIIDEFSCQGFDTFGPLKLIGGIAKGHPDKNDLKEAKKFARLLKIDYEKDKRIKKS